MEENVKITNVSKSKSPLYCGLADDSSLALQYKQSVVVKSSLITPYIKRRAMAGDYLLETVKAEKKVTGTNNKVTTETSGKKKSTVEEK